MARMPDLEIFAKKHGLRIVTIADLIQYRLQTERLVRRVDRAARSSSTRPAPSGRATVYESSTDGRQFVALDAGRRSPAPSRRSAACTRARSIGDVFASTPRDGGRNLREAIRRIEAERRGVIVYLPPRGALAARSRSSPARTSAPRRASRRPQPAVADSPLREFGLGAQILADLGLHKIRLLTNNPRKIAGLSGFGLEVVESVALGVDEPEAKKERPWPYQPRIVEGNLVVPQGSEVRDRREPLQSLHRRPPRRAARSTRSRVTAATTRTSPSCACPAPGRSRSPCSACAQSGVAGPKQAVARSSTRSSRSPPSSAGRRRTSTTSRARSSKGVAHVSLATGVPDRVRRPHDRHDRAGDRARRHEGRQQGLGRRGAARSRWSRSSARSTAQASEETRWARVDQAARPRCRCSSSSRRRARRADQAIELFWRTLRGRGSRGPPYADEIVRGVADNLDGVDKRDHAPPRRTGASSAWRRVDRNLLRLGTWELMYRSDVPRAVILDEAVELAKSLRHRRVERLRQRRARPHRERPRPQGRRSRDGSGTDARSSLRRAAISGASTR